MGTKYRFRKRIARSEKERERVTKVSSARLKIESHCALIYKSKRISNINCYTILNFKDDDFKPKSSSRAEESIE